MTSETMTVHKALSELKIIDDRINKAIHNASFIACKKHGANNAGGIEPEALAEQIKSAYQRAVDLIERRNAIKRALVRSNAETVVKIAGREYTVAEAIDMKQHGMDGWNDLYDRLSDQYAAVTTAAANENARIESRADDYIKSLFGSSDMTKASEEAANARSVFVRNQTVELLDPLDIAVKRVEIEDMISKFGAEVDAALSVSNALTEITVEY